MHRVSQPMQIAGDCRVASHGCGLLKLLIQMIKRVSTSLSASGAEASGGRRDRAVLPVYADGCMRSNTTIAWDYLDACVFVAHRKGRMVDADFGQFLEDVLSRSDVRRVVVRASEGAPRADHRAALLRWYSANAVRGSVLTDSALARGGVTAIGWFGVSIRAFPPHQLEQALDYVEIPIEHWPDAKSVMNAAIAMVDRILPDSA